MIGVILFFLYLAVLTYFLFFSEKYGRTAEREFSYNLTPFLEIRRFWNYREFLGLKAVFINLAGNVLAFVPFGAILPVISRRLSLGQSLMLTVLNNRRTPKDLKTKPL